MINFDVLELYPLPVPRCGIEYAYVELPRYQRCLFYGFFSVFALVYVQPFVLVVNQVDHYHFFLHYDATVGYAVGGAHHCCDEHRYVRYLRQTLPSACCLVAEEYGLPVTFVVEINDHGVIDDQEEYTYRAKHEADDGRGGDAEEQAYQHQHHQQGFHRLWFLVFKLY